MIHLLKMKLSTLQVDGWNQKKVILSQVTEPQKDKYYIFSLICEC